VQLKGQEDLTTQKNFLPGVDGKIRVGSDPSTDQIGSGHSFSSKMWVGSGRTHCGSGWVW